MKIETFDGGKDIRFSQLRLFELNTEFASEELASVDIISKVSLHKQVMRSLPYVLSLDKFTLLPPESNSCMPPKSENM